MHTKEGSDLIPADTELETTLKGLKEDKRAETATMTDEGLNSAANKDCVEEVLKEQDTMEDLWKLFIQDKYLAVRQLTIDANDFELKPALITMVQQNQFAGHFTENPNEHLGRFMRIANSIKLSGVKPEVIQLQLFPFSLRDKAVTWFNSLPYEFVSTWEELMGAYFSKFFPPPLISEQRLEVTDSKHGGSENMYATREDLAEYNISPSESSGRNGRTEESRMNELNRLSAIEAKLDELIHWWNERKSD